MYQSLAYFCTALKSIGDSWMLNHEWRDKSKYNLSSFQENASFQEIGQFSSFIEFAFVENIRFLIDRNICFLQLNLCWLLLIASLVWRTKGLM